MEEIFLHKTLNRPELQKEKKTKGGELCSGRPERESCRESR